MNNDTVVLGKWEVQFEQFLADQMATDIAHDSEHIRRVVANARRLALAEQANMLVVIPAAWLHDCVNVPKNSPERSQGSRLSAQRASEFLHDIGFDLAPIEQIAHAIEAHSFTAKIPPRTIEAAVVQDADRLDALGAIGVARCLMHGGATNRRLYHPADPFGEQREFDDQENTIDHFPLKLLRLSETMQTTAGRAEAEQRTRFLQQFLDQLRAELMV